MKLTNKNGLPETLVKAMLYDGHKRDGYYSVTELLQPVRTIHLKRRHDNEIEEDVSDKIWALFGNAIHYVLQKGETETSLVEQIISMDIAGVKLSGITDLYYNGKISDYKTTSVWSIMFKSQKKEWIDQLNLYAMLFRHAGFEVNSLEIVAIMRDWSKGEAKRKGDYPQSAVQVIPVELYPPERIKEIAENYIKNIELYKDTPDEDLPECTPEEKWQKETVYAVMKEGRKSAIKLYDNEVDADIAAKKEKGGYVETRKGRCIRCDDYCSVNKWCKYYTLETTETPKE